MLSAQILPIIAAFGLIACHPQEARPPAGSAVPEETDAVSANQVSMNESQPMPNDPTPPQGKPETKRPAPIPAPVQPPAEVDPVREVGNETPG